MGASSSRRSVQKLAPMGRSYDMGRSCKNAGQCILDLLVFNSTSRSRRACASAASGATCR